VTSLITGCTAGDCVLGGLGTVGAVNGPNCGGRAGAASGAWLSVVGNPEPVSDLGGIVGATLTVKPGPPAGTEVRSL